MNGAADSIARYIQSKSIVTAVPRPALSAHPNSTFETQDVIQCPNQENKAFSSYVVLTSHTSPPPRKFYGHC
jgi:hypothetical protein